TDFFLLFEHDERVLLLYNFKHVTPHRSASDEEAHRPPAKSVALHGNHQQCNQTTHTRSFTQFIRL
ncbi:hypothetical protein MOF27_27250, partial [Priestia megaterium]|nr:hypothetical protein [Priestia megaterium]